MAIIKEECEPEVGGWWVVGCNRWAAPPSSFCTLLICDRLSTVQDLSNLILFQSIQPITNLNQPNSLKPETSQAFLVISSSISSGHCPSLILINAIYPSSWQLQTPPPPLLRNNGELLLQSQQTVLQRETYRLLLIYDRPWRIRTCLSLKTRQGRGEWMEKTSWSSSLITGWTDWQGKE